MKKVRVILNLHLRAWLLLWRAIQGRFVIHGSYGIALPMYPGRANSLPNMSFMGPKLSSRHESVEIEGPGKLPIHLDAEPYRWDRIRFEAHSKAVRVVLSDGSPVIMRA